MFLTMGQLNALLAKVEGQKQYDTLIMFAALTGLRAAEIAGLRVRDVNLTVDHIEVRQTYTRINKGWTFGTPKSKRSVRDVPIVHKTLAMALKKHLLAHPDNGNPDALFWPGRHSKSHVLDYTRPVSTGAVLRFTLRPAAKLVGFLRASGCTTSATPTQA